MADQFVSRATCSFGESLRCGAALPPPEPGKGGAQHRNLKSLIRELGQQQGFRATVEAPVGDGQADVLGVLIESRAPGARCRETILAGVEEADRESVAFLTPEELPDYIQGLAPTPDPSETMVKGYRVKVNRIVASADETRTRRGAVVRTMARSLSRDG